MHFFFFLQSILIAHMLNFPSHQFVSAGQTVEDSGERKEFLEEAKDDRGK